jgi:tRNA uridine 5-carboxymethylaminomethyl modification enzyme
MFTSRAEFRLKLRADNADQRLTALGISIGCIAEDRQVAFREKTEALARGRAALDAVFLTPHQIKQMGIKVSQDGVLRSAFTLLSFPDVTPEAIAGIVPEFATLEPGIQRQIACDALYSQYIDRQQNEVDGLKRDESLLIPADFDYSILPGLSNELKMKLTKVQPGSIAHASRIEGMTPAALTLVLVRLRRAHLGVAAG